MQFNRTLFLEKRQGSLLEQGHLTELVWYKGTNFCNDKQTTFMQMSVH